MAEDITCVLNLGETEGSREGPNKEVSKDEGTVEKERKSSSSSSSSSSSINNSNNNNNNNNNNNGSDLSTCLRDMLMNWTEPGDQSGN